MSKQKQTAVVATSFADLVRTYSVAFVDILSTAATLADASQSCEGEMRDRIVAMSVECLADRGRFLAVAEELFGNGLNVKAEGYKAGTVAQSLNDAGANMASVRVMLVRARKACKWCADRSHATVDKDGKPLTLRKLAALHDGATKIASDGADETAKTKPETFEQMVASIGLATAMRKIAKMLREAEATERLAKMQSTLAEQVAATATK